MTNNCLLPRDQVVMQSLPQLRRLWSCGSTSLSKDFPLSTGSAVQVLVVPPLEKAIPERRFGPRRLRADDDELYSNSVF